LQTLLEHLSYVTDSLLLYASFWWCVAHLLLTAQVNSPMGQSKVLVLDTMISFNYDSITSTTTQGFMVL